MHVNGTYTFKASKEAVYDTMMSVDALQHCLPGAEEMVEIGPDTYRATLNIGIAGIKGVYVCTITTTNQVPNESWTLAVEGQAKQGQLKGIGNFVIKDEGEGTALSYEGEANMMGPLAGVAQRVMGPASRMIIGKFFECMNGQVMAAQTVQAD